MSAKPISISMQNDRARGHDQRPTVGALLAGGAGRRMGSPKQNLEIEGRPLYRWVADALEQLTSTCVQSGGPAIAGLGWSVIADRRPDAGPAAGIEAVLATFPGAYVVAVATDTPFVGAGLLGALLDGVSAGAPVCAPHHDGRWHPLVAAYSPVVLPALGAWLDGGRRDLQGFLDSVAAAPSPPGTSNLAAELLNVNTPEDLARARAYAASLST